MQACHLARICDIYYYYSQLLSQIFIEYFFDYLFTVSPSLAVSSQQPGFITEYSSLTQANRYRGNTRGNYNIPRKHH